MKSFRVLLFLSLALTNGFVITNRPLQTPSLLVRSLANGSYTDAQEQEMRDLIISLSLEPTDDARRTRVRDVFHEALSRPNGGPKDFCDLFDSVLISIGEEKQAEAKRKFFEDQDNSNQQQPEEENSVEEIESSDEPVAPREKSKDELALWALVDMMVQVSEQTSLQLFDE